MDDAEDPRFGALTVRAECPRCALPVPLNAPLTRPVCGMCQNAFEVSAETWGEILTACDDAVNGGVSLTKPERTFDGIKFSIGHQRGSPSCPRCGTAFLESSFAELKVHDFACTSCGHGACTYPAPSWLRQHARTARQVVVGERGAASLAQGVPVDAPDDVKPVVMSCPQCGGALHLTAASERTLPCHYCQVDVFLPDELWRRLHPVKTMSPWYVRFEGLSRAVAARRERAQQELRDAEARRAGDVLRAARSAAADADKARAALDAKTLAYRAVAFQCVFMVLSCLWVFIAPLFLIREAAVGVGYAVVIVSAVSVVVAVALAARPIKIATGYPGDAMLFVAWFFLIFGFLMPVVGAVMCLAVAAKRFLGTLGGNTITSNGNSTYYPPIRLENGEGRPLAFAYLAFALLWQPMLYALFNRT